MPSFTDSFRWFEHRRDYGAVFIRLAVAARLVYGAERTVFHPDAMQSFAGFLGEHGLPLPLVAAHISAWAQMICGLLFAAGALTRYAAVVMIINFLVAIFFFHLPDGDTFLDAFDALMMLASSFFFLFNGAGRPSVDGLLVRRSA